MATVQSIKVNVDEILSEVFVDEDAESEHEPEVLTLEEFTGYPRHQHNFA